MLSEADFKDVIVLQAFQALLAARNAAAMTSELQSLRVTLDGLIQRQREQAPTAPPASTLPPGPDSEGGTPE